jgi:hypothetical protein
VRLQKIRIIAIVAIEVCILYFVLTAWVEKQLHLTDWFILFGVIVAGLITIAVTTCRMRKK